MKKKLMSIMALAMFAFAISSCSKCEDCTGCVDSADNQEYCEKDANSKAEFDLAISLLEDLAGCTCE